MRKNVIFLASSRTTRIHRTAPLPSPVRLRGRQRGRIVIPRRRRHRRDERAHRRRQLDGGLSRADTRQTGHDSYKLRSHAAGLKSLNFNVLYFNLYHLF